MSSAIDKKEIAHFTKDAAHWWDEGGPHAPLHRLNPVRMKYLKAQICDHYGRGRDSLKPFEGLSVVDVGCGGGLVCEPMARLGADVTGLDADAAAIEVARAHAADSGLEIDYRNETTDDLLSSLRKQGSGDVKNKDPRLRGEGTSGGGFDIVLALEIIEHVPSPATFVESCARLLKPGGLIIFSTLNRTPKSFALGIVAAEYVLRWVPQGTHNWKKFVRPSELARYGRTADLSPHNVTGLVFNPLSNDFTLSESDIDVNYFMSATKGS